MLVEIDAPIGSLGKRLEQRQATVGVCGMGYVGLPLAAAAAGAGFSVTGFDIDQKKVELLNGGRSYIDRVPSGDLAELVAKGKFLAADDFSRLANCDVIAVCVPTPLTKHREPDLSYIEETARTIARSLRAGQLIVVESTTYPGTTNDVVKPILEAGGLKSGVDFALAYSPEREEPGNTDYRTTDIPKVVSGDGVKALELVSMFYGAFFSKIVPVKHTQTAEAVKLTENIFRSVNIALVNELKLIYNEMGIDVWEVIEAAKTKPFGYMPFYPGPGLGGHCIPIDPFYLTWKSREYEMPTRFIELAGEINRSMPQYVVDRTASALDQNSQVPMSKARVLIVGVSYKKNVADMRESPSLKLIELLERRGSDVEFHDPMIAEIPPTREHASLAGRRSVPIDATSIKAFDAVVVSTDHDEVDYRMIADHAALIVDTRNVFERNGLGNERIVKA